MKKEKKHPLDKHYVKREMKKARSLLIDSTDCFSRAQDAIKRFDCRDLLMDFNSGLIGFTENIWDAVEKIDLFNKRLDRMLDYYEEEDAKEESAKKDIKKIH